jgi:uncharacterized membrane protein YhaH (DUF805 family)
MKIFKNENERNAFWSLIIMYLISSLIKFLTGLLLQDGIFKKVVFSFLAGFGIGMIALIGIIVLVVILRKIKIWKRNF